MHINASILVAIPHLLQPDRIFQLDTNDIPYRHDTGTGTIMPARLETFHTGEAAVRSMLKVPAGRNPTAAGLPPSYARRAAESPLVAVGALDARGRPWTTLWGGERGCAAAIAPDVLGLRSAVDAAHDPVYHALWGGDEVAAARGATVRPGNDDDGGGGGGRMMAALAVDLETRDRVKIMGRMVAGTAADATAGTTVQVAMLVAESLGNCPKYLNKKRVTPRAYGADTEEVVVVAVGGAAARMLPEEATRLLDGADMFFLSSTDGDSMDTNHRGGPAGFVRVLKNEADEAVLVYPEYSGNRLYQTLGNLNVNPLVGIVVPDFNTSDVLYLTGSASILVGDAASAVMARTALAVRVRVTVARFVRRGLPFRGAPLERSPYNPNVRHLLSERDDPSSPPPPQRQQQSDVTATLTGREVLSPTVSRFTFALTGGPARWRPGQHVTLDFSAELDHGYAHMRDDDPQSLNDDFIRTFTVSNRPPPPPPPPPTDDDDDDEDDAVVEMQITARRHGPATNLLWRQDLRVAPLALPVLGFGGAASFRLPTTAADDDGARGPLVFVAGGVGITPLLAQARDVLAAAAAGVRLRLLWGLRAADLSLAADTFARIGGLAAVTTLFVTGEEEEEEGVAEDRPVVREVRRQGVAEIRQGRVTEGDVRSLRGRGSKFYLCTGPGLLRSLQDWLDGEDVVWEDFGY